MSIKVKINNDWVDTNIKAVRGVKNFNGNGNSDNTEENKESLPPINITLNPLQYIDNGEEEAPNIVKLRGIQIHNWEPYVKRGYTPILMRKLKYRNEAEYRCSNVDQDSQYLDYKKIGWRLRNMPSKSREAMTTITRDGVQYSTEYDNRLDYSYYCCGVQDGIVTNYSVNNYPDSINAFHYSIRDDGMLLWDYNRGEGNKDNILVTPQCLLDLVLGPKDSEVSNTDLLRAAIKNGSRSKVLMPKEDAQGNNTKNGKGIHCFVQYGFVFINIPNDANLQNYKITEKDFVSNIVPFKIKVTWNGVEGENGDRIYYDIDDIFNTEVPCGFQCDFYP